MKHLSGLAKHSLLLIIILGFLLYAQTLTFTYTYLDDNVLILDNLHFLRNVANIPRAFTLEVFHIIHASASYYRPILTVSLMFDAILSGQSPVLYHFTNIVLHVLATILLYRLLAHLIRHLHPALPLAFSLIFLTHPALTQTVAWIPGRNDSLLGVFTFASFLSLLKWVENYNPRSMIYHLILFAAALFTKESAIFLPLIFLIYLYIVVRKKLAITALQNLLLSWVGLFIVWYLLRRVALSTNSLNMGLSTQLLTILQNLPGALQLLGKTLFPLHLSVLPIIQDTPLHYGILTLIILSIILISYLIQAYRKKSDTWRLASFGIFWFITFLAPALIRPNKDVVPDFIEHRLYVPILGIFLILAPLVSQLMNLANKKYSTRTLLLGLYCLLIAAATLATLRHSLAFRNRISFWENAATTSPRSPLAHRNLGAMYYLDNRPDDALPQYEIALELNPLEQMAHNNIGLIYLDRGDYNRAQEEFLKELANFPAYDVAHFNLGLLYLKNEKPDLAEQAWLKTLSLNPDHRNAYVALSELYRSQGKENQAQKVLSEAFRRGLLP